MVASESALLAPLLGKIDPVTRQTLSAALKGRTSFDSWLVMQKLSHDPDDTIRRLAVDALKSYEEKVRTWVPGNGWETPEDLLAAAFQFKDRLNEVPGIAQGLQSLSKEPTSSKYLTFEKVYDSKFIHQLPEFRRWLVESPEIGAAVTAADPINLDLAAYLVFESDPTIREVGYKIIGKLNDKYLVSLLKVCMRRWWMPSSQALLDWSKEMNRRLPTMEKQHRNIFMEILNEIIGESGSTYPDSLKKDAAKMLGSIDDPNISKFIYQTLAKPNPRARYYAAVALEHRTDPESLRAKKLLTKDPDPAIRKLMGVSHSSGCSSLLTAIGLQ